MTPAGDTEEFTSTETALNADELGYVYVHVTSPASDGNLLLRIWPSTFLIPSDSSRESRLVYWRNIATAPNWTVVPKGEGFTFLLVFESLPKGCAVFDLVERIPQEGGFVIRGIQRNETDVYRVSLDDD